MKRAIDTVVGIAAVLVAASATFACGSSSGDGRNTVDTPAPVTSEPPPDNPNQPAVNPNQPDVNPNQPAVNPNQPDVNPNQPTQPPIGGVTITPSGPVDCLRQCAALSDCSADCTQQCSSLNLIATPCAVEVAAFLGCILDVGLACDGDQVAIPNDSCRDERRAMNDCARADRP
jgi:hypothetical protein